MNTEIPNEWIKSAATLKSEMISSLPTGSGVNLSVPNHIAITLALSDLAFDHTLQGQSLKICYSDTSRSRLFPLGSLHANELAKHLKKQRPLIFGLLSHRHPEMDYLVDAYFSTNRHMGSAISIADEDELSYSNAHYWFSSVNKSHPLVAYVLHSGLKPMVVGFYRALAEVLTPGKPPHGNLLIMPCILRPDLARGQASQRITPKTPGAKLDDYIILPAWY